MSFPCRSLISYPNISDLRYSNQVDLFKLLRVPEYNFAKTGQASAELDNVIKKRAIYVRGPVSAANKFEIPSKIDQKFVLTHRYCFIQCSPDISYHVEKAASVKFQAFTTITFYLKASNNTTIRLELSSLLEEPKISAAFIQLPLRIARWSTILLDFSQIFKLCYNESIAYAGFLQVEASATVAIKGVYFSNIKYSPFDTVEVLRMTAPNGYENAQFSNLIEHYDWIEYGTRPFHQVKRENIKLISEKDIFSHNFSGCLPYSCGLADFEKEYDEFCIAQTLKEEQKTERVVRVSKSEPEQSHLSESLSTYRAAKIKQPDPSQNKVIKEPEAKLDEKADVQEEEPIEEQFVSEDAIEGELSPEQNIERDTIPKISEEEEKSIALDQLPNSQKEITFEEDLGSIVAEQLIKDELEKNSEKITDSELQELKNAYKDGKAMREDDFETVNKTLTSVKVLEDDFKEKYREKMAELHSTFLPSIETNTVYSALAIENIIGCEISEKYSVTNMDVIEPADPDASLFTSLDLEILTTEAMMLINSTIGAPVLYQQDDQILINSNESEQYTPEILPDKELILLLNHVICASVIIVEEDKQFFISFDYIMNQLFKIEHTNKQDLELSQEIETFLTRTARSNVLLITPAENGHFVVVFENFCAIFQLLEAKDLKLRAVLHISVLKMSRVENCKFVNNGAALLFVGTNQAMSSLSVALVDLSRLVSTGIGWLSDNEQRFSVLQVALCMESLSNEEKHERAADILELSSEQFIILTNESMRLLRVKDGSELRLSSITENFAKYKQELISILESTVLRENKIASENKRSTAFNMRVHELISLYVNSSNISEAGIVPGTNKETLYLILSNIAIVKASVYDILQGKPVEIDGFLPHGFVPILCIAFSADEYVLTSDLAGNVFCHDGFCGKLIMEAKFKAPIIFCRPVREFCGYNMESAPGRFRQGSLTGVLLPSAGNASSEVFSGDSRNSEGGDDLCSIGSRQFAIIQRSGELAVFDISAQAEEYQKCYPLPAFPTHDFAFDPHHPELLMTTSAFDGNIINIYNPKERFNNYISTVTRRYLNAADIEFKNIVRYHPTSYVTAIYYPDYQQITLTDLSTAQTFYCSERLFPGSTGRYDMNFTANGGYLVLTSSAYGMRIYETIEKIKMAQSLDVLATRVETAELATEEGRKDIIVCIDTEGQIRLQMIDLAIAKTAFRKLDTSKEDLVYSLELGTKNEYVPCETMQSPFYEAQILTIKKYLGSAIGKLQNSTHELIINTAIRPEYDPAQLQFVRRKAVQINASECVPNLLSAIMCDVWRIPSMSRTARKSLCVECYSIEGYSLATGRAINSVLFATIVDEIETDCSCHLVESRIHGTYCCILAMDSVSYVYSLNIVVPIHNSRLRLGMLPFRVRDCKIACGEDEVAISHSGSSIFLFSWNCSNYCETKKEEEEMKEELARGIIELRLEKLVATSGICQYQSDSYSFRSGIVFI